MLRVAVLALAAIGLAGAAHADETRIVEACERATVLYGGYDAITTDDVQAFPELSPPRVQMRVYGPPRLQTAEVIAAEAEGRKATPTPVLIGTVRCEFTSTTSPVGLTKYCPPDGCFFAIPDRLEEVQVMLAREGY
jgi:hypothetical protein